MVTYEGTYNGMHYASISPNLYRVRYRRVIGNLTIDVNKVVTGSHPDVVRERIQRYPNIIRGTIAIEHVYTLEEQ